jgi:hypothetical protein
VLATARLCAMLLPRICCVIVLVDMFVILETRWAWQCCHGVVQGGDTCTFIVAFHGCAGDLGFAILDMVG